MVKYLVDLFCGAGGFSTGFSENKCQVHVAVDMWNVALEIHKRNHPTTLHKSFELGTDKSKKTVLSLLPKLKVGDTLHVHASPPCQNLSTANPDRSIITGLYLTLWTLQFLMELAKKDSRITWSIEQVPSPSLLSQLRFLHLPVFYQTFDMSEYGVCQMRKRLIISNVDLPKLMRKQKPPSLENVINVPLRSRYLANGNYTEKKVRDVSQFVRIAPIKKGSTLAYTVIQTPAALLDASKSLIRRLDVEDMAAIQSFPRGYFDFDKYNMTDLRQVIANSVPPKFAYQVSKAIDRHHGSRVNNVQL